MRKRDVIDASLSPGPSNTFKVNFQSFSRHRAPAGHKEFQEDELPFHLVPGCPGGSLLCRRAPTLCPTALQRDLSIVLKAAFSLELARNPNSVDSTAFANTHFCKYSHCFLVSTDISSFQTRRQSTAQDSQVTLVSLCPGFSPSTLLTVGAP